MTLLLLYLGFKVNGIAGMILAVPIGLFFVSLYDYGAFRKMTDSLGILIKDMNTFRKKE